MNILELYSGIGGMHLALNESGIPGKIVAAADINTVANSVYSYNFPKTLLLNRNIQSLTAKEINNLQIDAIFMSPPCQPFTRNGLKKDEADPRACSFSHLLNILPDLAVKYILIENVKGFETSILRNRLITCLKQSDFSYHEFILSPTQIGVSNTRHRYYCVAKRSPLRFHFSTGELQDKLLSKNKQCNLFPLSDIVEKNIQINDYLLSDSILKKRAMILDICTLNSKRSCCFTKAYGKYVEGTGSVLTSKPQEEIDKSYQELQGLDSNTDEYIQCIRKLELRFFTPKEVARLMSFPEYFSFPDNITRNQRYKLLGNSINVKVVTELVHILIEN